MMLTFGTNNDVNVYVEKFTLVKNSQCKNLDHTNLLTFLRSHLKDNFLTLQA